MDRNEERLQARVGQRGLSGRRPAQPDGELGTPGAQRSRALREVLDVVLAGAGRRGDIGSGAMDSIGRGTRWRARSLASSAPTARARAHSVRADRLLALLRGRRLLQSHAGAMCVAAPPVLLAQRLLAASDARPSGFLSEVLPTSWPSLVHATRAGLKLGESFARPRDVLDPGSGPAMS